ncbi:MAG: FkbM family methyltransferase [Alphaproteobacteria bacterium]|nr:FkbM family methyltransferase [Alphaproteobacteria bacterium]
MRKLIKLLRLLPNRTYRAALRYRVAATIEHDGFLRSESFATLIDAGANKGQFSLAARATHPEAEIVAFEPLDAPAAIFEQVFANDRRIRLIRAALGEQSGMAEIHVSRRMDSSSLLPIGKLQEQIFPGTEEAAIENVRVVRLDEELAVSGLPKPILLKIDVQGFELELLKGAKASLPHIDGIYTELSFVPLYSGQPLAHEVIAWLAEHDFRLAAIYHVSYRANGAAVQADVHFRRVSDPALPPTPPASTTL